MMSRRTKDNCRVLVIVFVGCMLVSVSINGIFVPFKLLSGGVTGISMLLNILLGIDINLTYILFNIPLFLIGIFTLSKRFMGYTVIGMIVFTVSLALTKDWVLPVQNELTAILLGGVLDGIGMGMIYNSGASLGGTDFLSKLFQIKFNMSISTANFAINFTIIGISMFFFGIDIAVYTLAAMYVTTEVSNYMIDGFRRKRMVLIISDGKKEELIDGISSKLKRGVTILRAEGAYTKREKDVLYCVVGITQISALKSIVRATDENAFMTITETAQVYGHGRGFYSLWEE